MERILDFSVPLDVGLLDQITFALYQGKDPQEKALAQQVLTQFKEHAEAWSKVDQILEQSQSQATKFFALQILEDVVKYRWNALPREQCDGIRNFIVDKVITNSSTEESLRSEKLYLDKLNIVLVQIIKQEWPRNWASFVEEIIGASRNNASLCENNMAILKALSEEIFDFAQGQLTQAKTDELKTSFSQQFAMIYNLCEFVLENAGKPELLSITLDTLLRFLSWIPIAYIFETNMVTLLINRFLEAPIFRNQAVKCLTEIGGLNIGNMHDQHFSQLLVMFMTKLESFLPPDTDIAEAYENGSQEDQDFVQDLAMFFTSFFRAHLKPMENLQPEALLAAHTYLAQVSLVDEEEIFKICLEYWNVLASDLFNESPFLRDENPATALMLSPAFQVQQQSSARRMSYAPILSRVRIAIIQRMAKPEEVLIVEDPDSGELIREEYPDNDAIIMYNNMRETLVYLTHLDQGDTIEIMKDKLAQQVHHSDFSWNKLNRLCWAIGSISGVQNEDDEKRFLVTVIRDLLGMCEMTRGKDNKAVIASNIMYIVGQYPRFLKAHWKFLRTVVNKLFEFMHESHPGVQDMACDTFLKIAKSCSHKFVVSQVGETQPFIFDILNNLSSITCDLELSQRYVFYKAVGHMIASSSHDQARQLLAEFMRVPNQKWASIIAEASRNPAVLNDINIAKDITVVLHTNVNVAASMGPEYILQLSNIFLEILHVYRHYSQQISDFIANMGPDATKRADIRSMRAVKRETLKLLQTFVQNSTDTDVVLEKFIPPLLEAVLGDYQSNIPDARDPEVLSLITAIINRLQESMTREIPRVFGCVFECTLGMISGNFQDYPDHRVNFFNLIQAVNEHCFPAFFEIPPEKFKLVIDSVVWAFKHSMRNIADTGLSILMSLWDRLSKSDAAQAFYQTYLISLLQDLFVVLTDSFHKSGFSMQSAMLLEIFYSVRSGAVQVPLWDVSAMQYPNNEEFLRAFIIDLIGNAFPNLTSQQVQAFSQGLFDKCQDLPAFKSHLRDFLVQIKEYSGKGDDNSELFLEEKERSKQEDRQRRMAIPGMIKPSELDG